MVENNLGNGITFSNTIEKAGKEMFGKKFIGVFPRDKIPMGRGYIIANTHKSGMPGEHWFAIARDGDKDILYDSFGRKILKGYSYPEDDPEQQKKETNCGQRSLTWLYMFDKFGPDCALMI